MKNQITPISSQKNYVTLRYIHTGLAFRLQGKDYVIINFYQDGLRNMATVLQITKYGQLDIVFMETNKRVRVLGEPVISMNTKGI